jgi:hypothetical protein
MKMLAEGKERVSTFKVCYASKVKLYDELVKTTSAQSAVDFIRKQHPDVKVVEVAKVVNNWK